MVFKDTNQICFQHTPLNLMIPVMSSMSSSSLTSSSSSGCGYSSHGTEEEAFNTFYGMCKVAANYLKSKKELASTATSRPREPPHFLHNCTAMAGAGGGGDGIPDADVTLIFVYGTLKRGFYNHTLLDDLIRTGGAAYLGPCTTVEAFPFVCGPYGIPYLVNLPGSGHRVRGELYSVSSVNGRDRLDELEGVERGHYERLPVAVADGGEEGSVDAEAYFAHRSFGEKLWKRCGEIGLGEFDLEMGKRYVRREDRPLDYSFINDIHKFILEEGSSST